MFARIATFEGGDTDRLQDEVPTEIRGERTSVDVYEVMFDQSM